MSVSLDCLPVCVTRGDASFPGCFFALLSFDYFFRLLPTLSHDSGERIERRADEGSARLVAKRGLHFMASGAGVVDSMI